jgi:DNA replication protein DnaC
VLDPVQREAIAAARQGGIVVSGRPGTGKSRLSNALAFDAMARGLTCLLVGDDPELDMAR